MHNDYILYLVGDKEYAEFVKIFLEKIIDTDKSYRETLIRRLENSINYNDIYNARTQKDLNVTMPFVVLFITELLKIYVVFMQLSSKFNLIVTTLIYAFGIVKLTNGSAIIRKEKSNFKNLFYKECIYLIKYSMGQKEENRAS